MASGGRNLPGEVEVAAVERTIRTRVLPGTVARHLAKGVVVFPAERSAAKSFLSQQE